ncbi:DEAD/DEAH box helicase [Deinococcus soli (ex Cha et al. 2016)]|uniref:Helicase n=2 Tax=Deinococcus soli (ex Cha et al. 2016) TaxID=1309411 RepID=A0ACC6KFI7_9DEIO|nr:DEAD/DEAH box helicase [Deinococcus soli (ex Cha et al. 2016)]MDR6218243.1 helicase [Deinococcus soli (ex Cha et al. 2016)]MDR6328983.1 helicase [Deinococcus soli (ex Cha et al. 2016)]MDR6751256.1 helicase [Deinococcus soli (ex Cha et al. 2016)]
MTLTLGAYGLTLGNLHVPLGQTGMTLTRAHLRTWLSSRRADTARRRAPEGGTYPNLAFGPQDVPAFDPAWPGAHLTLSPLTERGELLPKPHLRVTGTDGTREATTVLTDADVRALLGLPDPPPRCPKPARRATPEPERRVPTVLDAARAGGHLRAPGGLMVSAPTGTGKTHFARELALEQHAQGLKTVYLSPLRALAEEVAAHWSQDTPLKVGVFSGERVSGRYADFDVLVVTTEKFELLTRNWRRHWDWLPHVGAVIADEAHLIGQGRRGATLDSLIARTRQINPLARVILMTATAGNPHDLAAWVGGPVLTLTERPVPLTWETVTFKNAKDKPELLRGALRAGERALVFVQSRRRAESLARTLRDAGVRADRHHAGLTRAEREATEAAFRAGELGALICTPTLELGVNLPADHVVLYDDQRFERGAFKPLRVSDAWQRAGRAGRPGLGAAGRVTLIRAAWGQAVPYEQARFEPVLSTLYASPWSEGHAEARRLLTEHVLGDLASGLARCDASLERSAAWTLAGHLGRGRSLGMPALTATLEQAGMLTRTGTRLRVTRVGRVAAEHRLLAETVQFLWPLDPADLTPFDTLLALTLTPDFDGGVSPDYEQLGLFEQTLAGEESVLTARWQTHPGLLRALATTAALREAARAGTDAEAAARLGLFEGDLIGARRAVTRLARAWEDLLSVRGAPAGPVQLIRHAVDASLTPDAATLTFTRGVGPVTARRLARAGVTDLEHLAQLGQAELASLAQVSPAKAAAILEAAEQAVDTHATHLTFERAPGLDFSAPAVPPGVDPYRLRRAADLTVVRAGDHADVTGGSDPHRLTFTAGRWACDCPDYDRGFTCKHVLAVRLDGGDAALRAAQDALSGERLSLAALWLSRARSAAQLR